MIPRFLFPAQCRQIGWLLFVPAIITIVVLLCMGESITDGTEFKVFALANNGVMEKPQFFTIIKNSWSDEILLTMLIVGALLIGFSRLRNEDELISRIRFESLVWAVYVNFGVMIIATLFVYGMFFFDVMIANMFTVLVFFIIRFQLMLYKLEKEARDEE